jgi:hypothetical protein
MTKMRSVSADGPLPEGALPWRAGAGDGFAVVLS